LTAYTKCLVKNVGGRHGWRLPTFEELASLVDPDEPEIALPEGHPFTIPVNVIFWTATTDTADSDLAMWLELGDPPGMQGINAKAGPTTHRYWCVRGGHGYDGNP